MVEARIEAHIANWNGGGCISMVGRCVIDGIKELENQVRNSPGTTKRLHDAWQITRTKSMLEREQVLMHDFTL